MTKKNLTHLIPIVVSLCLILSACNLPANTPDPAIQQTSVAQTVEVLRAQLQAGTTPLAPTVAANTPDPLLPTATFTWTPELPTATFTSTPQLPSATATITATTGPAYKAGNVMDVNYPDDTVVKPNQTFTKTWNVTNLGTATWNANFKLIFVSGDAMGGPASQVLGRALAPGQSMDISVALKAPATPKTYQGMWMLETDSSAKFGIGANADKTFWVQVKVVKDFAVTAAVPVIVPPTHTGPCPVTMAITANITSTSAGTVTYYFKTSLGNSPTFSLVFDAAGTKTTPVYSLPVSATTALSVSVYNDTPNHQEFAAVVVPVNCTP